MDVVLIFFGLERCPSCLAGDPGEIQFVVRLAESARLGGGVEPVKVIGAAVAGAGTQGVVTAAVVTSVATAGTVAVTTDFGRPSSDRSVVVAPPVPEPSVTTSEPAPEPEPTTAEATPEPTPEPVVEPTPDPVPEPEPSPTPTPTDEATPEAIASVEPEPTPEPIVPTDYGIGAYTITNDDSLLQRRFTIPVTAASSGRSADQSVTVTIAFSRPAQFRGVVSPGWDCGTAVRDQVITTLTCTATLPAGQGTTFIAKARAIRPDGTISVSAADDPQPANNSVPFRADPYLLLL